MKPGKFLMLATIVATLVIGCVDQKTVDEIKSGLNDIRQQQGAIQDKLAKLEKGQKDLDTKVGNIKAAPAAPGRPAAPSGPFEISAKNVSFKGDPKAPVTIVEWSDFQCPFCSKIIPVIEGTLNDPEIKGKVNFVFKQFPLSFHKQAEPAAKAALAAGRQGKFFEMHDKLFEKQRGLKDDLYVELATEIGLDVEKFKKDFADPAILAQVKAEMAEGQKAGVRGTPTVFIGLNKGNKFVVQKAEVRSIEGYEKMVKDALKKAGKG